MFTKKKCYLLSIALALLVFTDHASTGSNTNDERTTTPAISSNDNNDNANPSPDFDGDGTVGISDFLLFVDVFGSRQGDEGYDARFDLDSNGTIGISDFLIFSENFGKEVPLDDRAVLVALYKATDGSNWTNKKNWLSDRPLREWYGVTTDANGRVTRLSLFNNNLRGPIPVKLAQLTKLERLYLRNNQLTGTIPKELAQLSNLTRLALYRNPDLSGPLPPAFTDLSLEVLDLAGTGVCVPLTGAFVEWLNSIPAKRGGTHCADSERDALIALYKQTNGPNWTNNKNWTALEPLGDWYGVTTDANGRVTELNLRDNNLSGLLPPSLSNLANLKTLNLADNAALSGPLPQGFTRLSLGSLELERTRLCTPPLAEFQTWVNGIRDSEVAQCTDTRPDFYPLVALYSGTDGPNWTNATNWASDALLSDWYGVTTDANGRVTELSLNDNNLQGPIPVELGQLSNLKELYLYGNQLTGTIPSELGQLSNLTWLELQRNQLTGTMPSELGLLANLETLWIENNTLTGEIPPELGHLTNLTELDLGRNQLSGNIPSELGQLANLEKLNLSTNQLSGNIPSELGQLANLRELNLSTNQLSGNIPPELGLLANLTTLNLGFNSALSGTLPNAITDLSLESLKLSETLLCSPQDAEFQAWLRGIPFSRVPNCVRSDETAAYLVQATQSLEYPVPLLAGEAALLRVFVISEQDVEATLPPVRATFYKDGVEVHTANIGSQATSIPYQVNEASLLSSANAVVPGSVVMPGLEMVVEIDPDQTLDPALGIVARLPQTGRTALDVRSVLPFELTLIPFLWEENPDRSVLAQTEGLSSESDLFRLTRDILPVSEFRLTVHEPVLTSVDPTSDASGILEAETKLIYAMEGAKGYYMGIFRSKGVRGLRGLAPRPGYTSLSILDENVIAHELGHNLSLRHAPGCGAVGPDPEYPYGEGAIGAWGYDFVNKSLVSPATSDIMTYCDTQWISDYSFTRALARRSQAESATLAAAYAPPTKGLLIWGGLDEDEKPFLEPAFVVNAPPSLPRIDGPYQLTGEDNDGNNLFSLPFGIPEYGCGGKGGAFAFILPVQDDWAGRLARIALSAPEGVSILNGEDGPSATLLLDRATGNVRGILRDRSEAAAKRPATRHLSPDRDLEVLTSHGIPDAASWAR